MLNACRYIKTDKEENADIIIFNTCCVRENAEDRLYGKLEKLKSIKKIRNNNLCWWLHDATRTCLKK